MIIAVRENKETRHVQVNEKDSDKARSIAFRFIHKRREADFNELVHNTHSIEVQECQQSVADVLWQLR